MNLHIIPVRRLSRYCQLLPRAVWLSRDDGRLILASAGSNKDSLTLTATHTFFIGGTAPSDASSSVGVLFVVVDELASSVGEVGCALLRLPPGANGDSFYPKNAEQALRLIVEVRSRGQGAEDVASSVSGPCCLVFEIVGGGLGARDAFVKFIRALHPRGEETCRIFYSDGAVINCIASGTSVAQSMKNFFSRSSSVTTRGKSAGKPVITISPFAARNLKRALKSPWSHPSVASHSEAAAAAAAADHDHRPFADNSIEEPSNVVLSAKNSSPALSRHPLIQLRDASRRTVGSGSGSTTRILDLMRRIKQLKQNGELAGDVKVNENGDETNQVKTAAPRQLNAGEGSAIASSSGTKRQLGKDEEGDTGAPSFKPRPDEIVDGTASWEPATLEMSSVECEIRLQQMLLSLIVINICTARKKAQRAEEMAAAERQLLSLPTML